MATTSPPNEMAFAEAAPVASGRPEVVVALPATPVEVAPDEPAAVEEATMAVLLRTAVELTPGTMGTTTLGSGPTGVAVGVGTPEAGGAGGEAGGAEGATSALDAADGTGTTTEAEYPAGGVAGGA